MTVACIFIVVISTLAAFAKSVEVDTPFNQDISHKNIFSDAPSMANWPKLPFGNIDSMIHLNAPADCFVSSIRDSQQIYASPQNKNKNKVQLNVPYNGFTLLYAMEQSSFSSTANRKIMVPAVAGSSPEYSFFVVSSSTVFGAKLVASNSSECGEVAVFENLLSPEQEQEDWVDVLSATASASSVWVATKMGGLVQVHLQYGSVEKVLSQDVLSVYWVDAWKQLFVSTESVLYMYTYGGDDREMTLTSRQHEWIGGLIDSPVMDMTYDSKNDAVWIAEANAVHKLSNDQRWWRYGQRQGAPFDSISSVAAVNGYIYVGSQKGLARVAGDADPTQKYQISSNTGTSSSSSSSASSYHQGTMHADPWVWRFYGGNRYLPDNAVSAVVTNEKSSNADGDGEIVVGVITETGLTWMEVSMWTLAEKSVSLEQFQYPRHNRRGLVADCQLAEYGNVDSYVKQVKDNDGLWTTMSVSEINVAI